MASAESPRRDPALILDLFWGTTPPPRRGPRGGLTVARVVAAAVEIADAEGLEAVSMRRVAEALGVTTMSLYRYVPGKDELCELMLDHAAVPPGTDDWPVAWRPRLERYAHELHGTYLAHSWMLDVPVSGPPIGPNSLGWMEVALETLDRTGLGEADIFRALTVLTGYIRYDAGIVHALTRAEPRTGVAPEEWGHVYGQMLGRVIDDGRFPTLARIAGSDVFAQQASVEEDFAWGLEFILDGVAAMVAERGAVGRDRATPGEEA
ncbi:TetR/AcrR family transcriptional regulator [Streptomyces otsuchiensis]|uniref:TetR/AcrR family transcriptional regulator n=1 Tax=Streptomyces otsuchiensis TaxID=2681388 RepID=UPI001477083E|nr:TetR/AcrR family transcriptional regulator [Streptomyces otsuchiensis]